MKGHPPISDSGLLLGSVFVAVSIVGIGILGNQQGPQQMASTQPVAMTAAATTPAATTASKQPCLPSNETNQASVKTSCVDGCHYVVHGGSFPAKATVTATTQYPDGSKNPGTVQFEAAGASSFTSLTCKGGSASTLGDATGQGALGANGLTGLVGSGANSMNVEQPSNVAPAGAAAGAQSAADVAPSTSGSTQYPACPGSTNTGDIRCYVQNGTQYTYSLSDWEQAGGTAANAPGAPGSTIAPDNSLVGGPTSAAVPGASPAMTEQDIQQLQNAGAVTAPPPSSAGAGVSNTFKGLNSSMNTGDVGDLTTPNSPSNSNLFYGLNPSMDTGDVGDFTAPCGTFENPCPPPPVSTTLSTNAAGQTVPLGSPTTQTQGVSPTIMPTNSGQSNEFGTTLYNPAAVNPNDEFNTGTQSSAQGSGWANSKFTACFFGYLGC